MFNTVVTIICNPARPMLDNAFAGHVAAALDDLDCGPVHREVLGAGLADDFFVGCGWEPKALRAALADRLGAAPVDIVAQRPEGRAKRLLVADMDSTIIEQECLDELADFAGLKPEIAAITERAMRGELDFEAALTERVGMLKGLPERALEEAYRTRITLTPGAETLVATMNARGAETVLVSGGFTYFVSRVAERVGFHHIRANDLVIAGGRLTGDVARPILGREAKEAALIEHATRIGAGPHETLAVGDGANDLAMIARAGLGVAFRAKPAVAAAADASIAHGDLTALLYAQGVKQAAFTSTPQA